MLIFVKIITRYKSLKMNTLELKGGMIEMIANVNNPKLLQQLYQTMAEIIVQKTTEEYQLTAKQEAALDADIEASFNPANLVDHEVAIQKMSRWLNP